MDPHPDFLARLRGALADRYTVERELGRGGMATVYLARDLKHDRAVALKVLNLELANAIGPERFLREIQVTASLHHPHILQLYDSGQTDGFLYYVMPLAEGESLRDRLIREKQLPVDDALQIAREVADALSYAHSRGLIHRDIKPENILLAGDHALVSDFGIARAILAAGGEALTETGLAIGTPLYMSPEQASGARDLDARSDIYALGCVIYEMLAGQAPFTGTVESVIHQHLAAEPPDVASLRPAVPPTVGAALRRALAKTPADRFTTATRFAEALAGGTRPVATELRTTAAAGQSRLLRLRSPWAMVVVVTAVALWGWLRPRPAPPAPVVRFQVLVTREPWDLGWQGRLALSPDGSLLVYRDSAASGTQLFVRSVGDLEARPLRGTAGARNPFVSHDGKWVGFIRGSEILKVPLDGGLPVTLASTAGVILGADWDPDGTIVFSDDAAGLVRVAGDSSGAPSTIVEGDIGPPDVLPSGNAALVVSRPRGAAATRARGNDGLAVVALETGALTTFGLRGGQPQYVPPGFVVYGAGGGYPAPAALLAVPFDIRRLTVTGAPITLAPDLLHPSAFAVSSTTLAYLRAGTSDRSTLVSVTREGNATELDPDWREDFRTLALSRDGTRVGVSVADRTEEHVWITHLPDGSRSKLTLHGPRNSRPAWAPDGHTVTFISNREEQAPMRLYAQPGDGSRGAEPLVTDTAGIWEGAWSADARWLVFRRDGADANEDLYAIRPGLDSVPRELFATPVTQEWNVTFSPDGRWIAFTSDETGRSEVFVCPFPEVTRSKWLVSSGGGTEPIWSRDGREIFYRSGSNQMVAAAVNTEPTFRVVTRQVLFDAAPFRPGELGRAYDVTPDGTHFIMIRTGQRGDAPQELILVQNFVEELKAAVRGRGAARRSSER